MITLKMAILSMLLSFSIRFAANIAIINDVDNTYKRIQRSPSDSLGIRAELVLTKEKKVL